MSDDNAIYDTFRTADGKLVVEGQPLDELPANERLIRRLQDAWDIVEGIVRRDPFLALTQGVVWCMYCGNGRDEHEQRGDCLWVDACRVFAGESKRIPARPVGRAATRQETP